MIHILALHRPEDGNMNSRNNRCLQCNKITSIHPTAFVGLCKIFTLPTNARNM